jgi:hypothetical protein
VSISVDKLLAKIEEELRLAKNSGKQESLREKVYSIKILCELILDEKQENKEIPVNTAATFQPVIQQQVFQQPLISQQSLNQPKKIDMDNEANGDSLFDF